MDREIASHAAHSPATRRFARTAFRSMLPVVSTGASSGARSASAGASTSAVRAAVEPSRFSSGAGSRRGCRRLHRVGRARHGDRGPGLVLARSAPRRCARSTERRTTGHLPGRRVPGGAVGLALVLDDAREHLGAGVGRVHGAAGDEGHRRLGGRGRRAAAGAAVAAAAARRLAERRAARGGGHRTHRAGARPGGHAALVGDLLLPGLVGLAAREDGTTAEHEDGAEQDGGHDAGDPGDQRAEHRRRPSRRRSRRRGTRPAARDGARRRRDGRRRPRGRPVPARRGGPRRR